MKFKILWLCDCDLKVIHEHQKLEMSHKVRPLRAGCSFKTYHSEHRRTYLNNQKLLSSPLRY